jgi:hypothetical protein
MTTYNLYLLDVSRDPRVLEKLSRLSGLSLSILRREFRYAPFLVLKESPLSEAVAVRRELERMGLGLRLERVDSPTGDRTHPLAAESEGDDELVLEEGAGFEVDSPPAEGARGERPRWLIPVAGLLAGVLLTLFLIAVYSSWQGGGRAETAIPVMPAPDLQEELGLLTVEAKALLSEGHSGAPERIQELLARLDALELKLAPYWNKLNPTSRAKMEELGAMGRTLSLRRDQARAAGSARSELQQALELTDPGSTFNHLLARELEEGRQAENLLELVKSEGLLETTERLLARGANLAETLGNLAPSRLDEKMDAFRARVLAGQLQLKGVSWIPLGDGLVAQSDLPTGLRLELFSEGRPLADAVVEVGELHFDELPADAGSVSLKLAALDRQPPALARLLGLCLRLSDPILYDATLPGSQLPRLQGDRLTNPLISPSEAELNAELLGMGYSGGGPDLPRFHSDKATRAEFALTIRQIARKYQEMRVWPRRVELIFRERVYAFSGQELFLLSRSSELD